MADGAPERDRYLPFNLCTVMPFESNAAALQALPTVQPRPPAGHSLLPAFEALDAPLDHGTRDLMMDILKETAEGDEWNLEKEVGNDGDELASDSPAWVLEIANALPELVPKQGSSGSKHQKRPRGNSSSYPDPERVQRRRQLSTEQNPTRQPMGEVSPSRETQIPLDYGVDDMDEEEEEQRERAVHEAGALAERDDVRRFVRDLEAFVDRLDSKALRAEGGISEARLDLTSKVKYMKELFLNVQLHTERGYVSFVPEDVLKTVIGALVARVAAESERASALQKRPAPPASLAAGELGIRCACIVLTLLSAPTIPRTLLLQDTLDSCLRLLRAISTHIFYPAFDALYTIPVSSSKRTGRNVQASVSGGRGPGEESAESASSGLDDDTSESVGAGPHANTKLKAASKREIEKVLQLSVSVYGRFTEIVRRETGLAESFISEILNLCLPAFGVEGISVLQIAAGNLVEAVVASYPDQDIYIVDRLREHVGVLPANRRSLRHFIIESKAKSVRVVTAVLIKVLNVIGGRNMEAIAGDGKDGSAVDEMKNQVTRLAFRFVDGMLDRTFRDRDSEYRAALSAFFTDILELFTLPEWPSAELLTQTFGLRLVITLNKGSEVSVQTRVICLDMLGQLAARACSLYGSGALLSPEKTYENLWTDEKYLTQVVKERVVLLSYLNDRGKADESCRFANRFDFVQFAVDDADTCESFHRARHASLEKEGGEAPRISSDQVLRLRRDAMHSGFRALVDSIRKHRGPYDGHRSDAVVAALSVGQHRLFIRQLPKIIDTIRDGLQQPEPTLRTKAIKTLSGIADAEPAVLACVPALLLAIEASCMDVSKSVREAALDLLSRTVSSMDSSGQASKESEANASGTNKHAAAGSSPAYGADFFEKVFPIVQKRLLDSATSVRKRAIVIMRGVLVDAMSQALRQRGGSREQTARLDRLIVRVCYTLSDRVDDRECSVRESAERALRLALFGFDPSNLGTIPTFAQDEVSAGIFASRLVSVFGAVINNPKSTPTQRNLVGLVLHDAIIVKRRRLLNLICNDVVEILHVAESVLAGKTALYEDKERPLCEQDRVTLWREIEAVHRKRLACSSVLEAFAKVEADLIVTHCHALTPYVKGVVEAKRRSNAELRHVARVLSILEICVPVAGRSFSEERLEEVIGDVEKIVCMCPSAAIAQPAIKCFCVLARHSSNNDMVAMPTQTSRLFFEFLQGARDELAAAQSFSNSESIRNARQALPRLGLLARYGDFDDDYISSIYDVLQHICSGMVRDWIRGSASTDLATLSVDAPVANIVGGNTVEGKKYAFSLRVGSIRSLLYFLARHRSYLPRATSILVVCLRQGGGDVDCDAQMTVLSGMQDMLVEEEARNVLESEKIGKKLKRAAPGAKGDVVLAAEEDVEAGFLAVCAQAVVPELNRTAQSSSAEVRKAVVTSLGLLARQGLVLPAKIVPALFGLLVDGDSACREGAHHVVSFLSERYPGMLSSAALGAVRQTFSPAMLTRELSSSSNILQHVCGSAVDSASGYALLSTALTQIQRDQRRGILCGVVKEFDPRVKTVSMRPGIISSLPNGGETALSPSLSRGNHVREDDDVAISGAVTLLGAGVGSSLPNLAFYAVTLATMDYAGGSSVGGSLTVGGGTAAADGKLKSGREDVSEICAVMSRILSNSGQAVLEAAAQIPAVEGNELKKLKYEVARHCAPLCMLLLVKRFLKRTRWNLSPTERDDEENGGDSSIVAAPVFDLSQIPFAFEHSDDPSHLGGRWSISDPDAFLQVFRGLMRDDTVDDLEPTVGSGRRKTGVGRRRNTTPNARRKPSKKSERAHTPMGTSCAIRPKKRKRNKYKLTPDDDFIDGEEEEDDDVTFTLEC